MKNAIEYNYRTRSNADEMCFGRGDSGHKLTFDKFSLPPKPEADAREFAIVERPPIPDLVGFVERYM